VADVGPSGAGTSKGSPVASSSFGWTTEGLASEGGPTIHVDSAKDFPMKPAGTDAGAKTIEATSSFGSVSNFFTPAIYYALPKQSFVVGVSPLGASASREPTRLPGGTRSEVSTSATADAAELDAFITTYPLISLN